MYRWDVVPWRTRCYERVLVPPAVIAELDHPATLAAVRTWLAHRPEWIVIGRLQSPSDTPQALPELDPGEREAIQLALEAHADLLLMDEKLGMASHADGG